MNFSPAVLFSVAAAAVSVADCGLIQHRPALPIPAMAFATLAAAPGRTVVVRRGDSGALYLAACGYLAAAPLAIGGLLFEPMLTAQKLAELSQAIYHDPCHHSQLRRLKVDLPHVGAGSWFPLVLSVLTGLTDLDVGGGPDLLPPAVLATVRRLTMRSLSVEIVDLSAATQLRVIAPGFLANSVNVTRVVFPPPQVNRIRSIRSGAMKHCSQLASLDLRGCSKLTVIGDGFCAGCVALTEAHLPPSLVDIGFGAFRQCRALRAIDLSANHSLAYIGGQFALGCTALPTVVFPPCPRFTVLYEGSLDGCRNLRRLDLSHTHVEVIEAYVGANGAAADVVFPRSLQEMHKLAFQK